MQELYLDDREMDKQKVHKRFDNIIKSENDDRLYRGLLLSNAMQVILISDPVTDKAAVAMDVRIGFTGDPYDVQGLAHLCQHILYLTNEKNTPQKSFKNYVLKNNGTASAKVLEDNTIYYFDIAVDKFKDAFPRFAEFFVKPFDFSEALFEAEVKHVEHERVLHTACDKWMLHKLIKWNICRYHPISKYRNGSMQSFLKDKDCPKPKAMELLREFHKRYYQANSMTLCILSKENLDELENLVVEIFSPMKMYPYSLVPIFIAPNCPNVYKIWCAPYGKKSCQRLYLVFPIYNLRMYNTLAADRFLAYLFEYEGKGMFASVLKTKGWVKSLEAGDIPCGKNFNFFSIVANVTDEGLEHVDDIVTLFLQYTNLLKDTRPSIRRRLFNEFKEIRELKFRFKEKESPLTYVKMLANKGQYPGMKYVLFQEYIPDKWRSDFIPKVMNFFLSPLRMRIFMVASKYKDFATEELEPSHQLQFRKEMVPIKTCAKWLNMSGQMRLEIPPYNEFIPRMTTVKPQDDNEYKFCRFPTIIGETNHITLWHKKDDVFNEPRAVMIFHFISPYAYADSINMHLTLMYVRLINQSLSEHLHAAALVDLRWELCATVYGVLLQISGFDDKQNVLLDKIMELMMNLKINMEDFEVHRLHNMQLSKKELEEFESKKAYIQAQYYLPLLLTDRLLTKEEILKANDQVTFEKFQRFKSEFFSEIHVDSLIHGNVTKLEALNILDRLEDKLKNAMPLSKKDLELFRDVKLPEGYHFVYEKTNEFNKSSCTLVFYQINERSVRLDVLMELAQQIMNGYNDVAKTKEDLGYIVSCGIHRTNEMQGITVLVQNRNSCSHYNLERRINKFVDSMVDYIFRMSEQTFKEKKNLLLESCHAKKPKTLSDQTSAFWAEILNRQYKFNRINDEINWIKKITHNDLNYLVVSKIANKKVPTLSVHITSAYQYDTIETAPQIRKTIKRINDIKSFKNSQILCPLSELSASEEEVKSKKK